MDFKDWLRDRRRNVGISQDELADIVGVTQPTVSQWENGERPGADYVALIATALRVDLGEILQMTYPGLVTPSREWKDDSSSTMRPLEAAVAWELQYLDETALSMILDQIRHVFGPRFRKREGHEQMADTISADHGSDAVHDK